MKGIFPIADSLKNYNRAFFKKDVLAGITVAIMLIPQGMAYALLAGIPPIYGLYGGLIPLFLYALFGSSRQLSIGPVAISALLVMAGVSQIAEPFSTTYLELVILTGLLVGILQSLLSWLKMGFLVNFLSHPVIVGFTSGAAIIIFISQLKDFLGIAIPRFDQAHETLWYALTHLHEINWVAFGICAASIVIMIIGKRFLKNFPWALLVVILATIASGLGKLDQYGVDIVGTIPEGLPFFQLPSITIENIRALMPTALTVTIIGIVESISIAKVLESKHQDYVVRPNQELFALGISKIGGAFFQAIPTSGSFTRSAVNSDMGAKTTVASLITVGFVALTLLFLIPLFYFLPKAVLAAIILLAVKGLFDFEEVVYLWKTHRQDFAMLFTTFIITLIIGIEAGVLAGVLLSIAMVLYRSSTPHMAVLGNLSGTKSYRNIERFNHLDIRKNILIVRFDDQLYFANVAYFKETIKELVREKGKDLEAIVLEAQSIHDMDSSGLHALEEVCNFLQKEQIAFYMCGAIGPVRDILYRSKLMNKIGDQHQFLSIHDAVTYHQTKSDDSVETEGWSELAIQTNIDLEEE